MDTRGNDKLEGSSKLSLYVELDILKRAGCADLRLAVHREAEEAVVGLKSGRVSPDRRVLLPQQRGQAGQDLKEQTSLNLHCTFQNEEQ